MSTVREIIQVNSKRMNNNTTTNAHTHAQGPTPSLPLPLISESLHQHVCRHWLTVSSLSAEGNSLVVRKENNFDILTLKLAVPNCSTGTHLLLLCP